MAFDIGINFRSTAGYVTDPAGTTYCRGDMYPTTRGGFTFGWIDNPGGNIRDRSLTVDPRIAGITYHSGSDAVKRKFRIDLPASGAIDVYCALGDATTSLNGYLEVFDDTSSLGVAVTKHVSVTSGSFYDASDVIRTAANWPSLNVKRSYTMATTAFIVAMTPGDSLGGNYCISHLRVVQAGGGSPVFGKVNVGGTWKDVSAIQVNVGGVWKSVTEAKVNVSGSWKTLA